MPGREELRLFLIAFVLLATLTGVPIGLLYFCVRSRRTLLPAQRQRSMVWSGTEVFLLFLATQLLWPPLIYYALYGMPADEPRRDAEFARQLIWVNLLSVPPQLLTIWAVLHSLRDARLYQMGIHLGRLPQNMVVGWLAWLLLGPSIFLFHLMLLQLYGRFSPVAPEEHPIVKLVEGQPATLDWMLFLLSVAVAAPVFEEVLFRGVLQTWLTYRRERSDGVLAICTILACFQRSERFHEALGMRDLKMIFHALEPLWFVLLMVPGYYVVCGWKNSRLSVSARAGIFTSSLLFAISHTSVWPTPIPLFLLAIGLGYLSYRTQSLIPSIVFHGLFNAVTFVVLLLGQPTIVNGKEDTTTLNRVDSVLTSNLVPGSWEPRRT